LTITLHYAQSVNIALRTGLFLRRLLLEVVVLLEVLELLLRPEKLRQHLFVQGQGLVGISDMLDVRLLWLLKYFRLWVNEVFF
jgi:hypothetical protein